MGMCVHCLTDYWNDIKIWKRLQKGYVSAMGFEGFKDAYYAEARAEMNFPNCRFTPERIERILEHETFV